MALRVQRMRQDMDRATALRGLQQPIQLPADDAALVGLGRSACTQLAYDVQHRQSAAASYLKAAAVDYPTVYAITWSATRHLCPGTAAEPISPHFNGARADAGGVHARSGAGGVAHPPPATAPAPDTTGGPLATVSDGTYEVGTGDGQVAPGKYKSTGPDGGTVCYYARLRQNDGNTGDIITNNVSQGPNIMNVKASDGYVQVTGCTLTKT